MKNSKRSTAYLQRLADRLPSPKAIRAEKARRAKGSLAKFARFVDPSILNPPHIAALTEKLEAVERGEVKRLMVFMPPRHGKSDRTTKKFPAWFLGRNPNRKVIVASHSAGLADTFSREARDTLREYGPMIFGIGVSDASSAVQHWSVGGRKGELFACGVDGGATGQGADLLLIDDPVKNREEAFSSGQRDKVWDWYRGVARTRVHPGGAIVLIMTRWHQDDLAGRLLEESAKGMGEQWDVVSMPLVRDNDIKLPGTHEKEAFIKAIEGRVLWPDRYPPEEIFNIYRSVGSYFWESLFEQRPANPQGDIFKRASWKYYALADKGIGVARIGVRLVDLRAIEWIAHSWDCTFKDTDGTDFVAGHVWGGIGADCFLLDRVHDRMGLPATLNAARTLAKKWDALLPRIAPTCAKYVEDKANGPAVVQTLKQEIPGLIEVTPEGGKEARARAISPMHEAGNLWLPVDAPWCEDVVSEFAEFPAGKHDDDVDAASQLLIKVSAERAVNSAAAALTRW